MVRAAAVAREVAAAKAAAVLPVRVRAAMAAIKEVKAALPHGVASEDADPSGVTATTKEG